MRIRTKLNRALGESRRRWRALAAAVAVAVALSGCGPLAGGTAGVAGVLGRLRPLEANCQRQPVSAYFALDLDGRDRAQNLITPRLVELQGLADQAAACGGELQAVGFGLSAADTPVLAQASFPTSFGTDTARLIKANAAEGELMRQVRANLPAALRAVSPTGNDVIARLVLARQFHTEHPGRLLVELATSGISTLGPVRMDTSAFTRAVARAAGRSVPVPNLSGASVRFVGIGQSRVPGRQLSTGLVWNLTTFYTIACGRTGARCQVTTS